MVGTESEITGHVEEQIVFSKETSLAQSCDEKARKEITHVYFAFLDKIHGLEVVTCIHNRLPREVHPAEQIG